jgi:glycosyltransferase involved in cell wall biosynthesis
MMKTVPVSAIIPTKDRPALLTRAIRTLLASTVVPAEIVVVDASADDSAAAAVRSLVGQMDRAPNIIVRQADRTGAAAQRNQAIALARNDYILFCDDDIVCEPDCVERLWNALQSDPGIGGANAMIVNQNYSRPGRLLRAVLAAIAEPEGGGYAGRVVGPVIHFLPRDGADLPATMPVQWLNLGCTLYRRELLPEPPFDAFFTGYSLREDVALSLHVGRHARLVNVPAARIYHDSQPGAHKADIIALSRMDTVSRHYVMTAVMGKYGWADGARLAIWDCCQLGICALGERGGVAFWRMLYGKCLACADIVRAQLARNA